MEELLLPEEPPPQPAASTLNAPAAIVVRTVLCHMFLTPKIDTMFKGLQRRCQHAGPGPEKRSEVSSVDTAVSLSSNNDRPGTRKVGLSTARKSLCDLDSTAAIWMRGYTRHAGALDQHVVHCNT